MYSSMKRILITVITFLTLFFCVSCSFNSDSTKDMLTQLKSQDSSPSYVIGYNRVVTRNDTIDVEKILNTQFDEKYHLEEIYATKNNRIYFSVECSLNEASMNGNVKEWLIVSMDLNDKICTIHYKGNFCKNDTENISQKYEVSYMRSYNEKNGYYFDNKIVLNDMEKLVEYDISTDTYNEYNSLNFAFPDNELKIVSTTNTSVQVEKNGNVKLFSLENEAKANEEISKIFSQSKEETIDGTSKFKYFFTKVQTVNNEDYFICNILTDWGHSYAILLKYNFEDNSCKYVANIYTYDVVKTGFYLINS